MLACPTSGIDIARGCAEFDVDIFRERIGRAEVVDLHRVVDDQVDGDERVDALGVLPPGRATAERMAARSTSSGTPVKSCSTMRASTKRISSVRGVFWGCPGQGLTCALGDALAVAVPEHRLRARCEPTRAGGTFWGRAPCQRRQRIELAGACRASRISRSVLRGALRH